MDLLEYIRQSYPRPNRRVLEALGANNALIEYLETTPWNTNISVVMSLADISSSDEAVVGTAVVGVSKVGGGGDVPTLDKKIYLNNGTERGTYVINTTLTTPSLLDSSSAPAGSDEIACLYYNLNTMAESEINEISIFAEYLSVDDFKEFEWTSFNKGYDYVDFNWDNIYLRFSSTEIHYYIDE